MTQGSPQRGKRPGTRLPVGEGDLEAVGRLAGADYRVRAANGPGAQLLEGRVSYRTFESGISLHATDAIEMTDLKSEVVLGAGLCVMLLLEGAVDASLDGTSLKFRAEGAPSGRIWSLTRPTTLIRVSAQGRHVRKVNVNVPPPWLEKRLGGGRATSGELADFLRAQLSIKAWTPSAGSVRGAEEILAVGDGDGLLDQLTLERNALDILSDALSRFHPLTAGTTVPDHVSLRDMSRAQAVRDLILRSLDKDVNLPELARASGMSTSTLQRVFRKCYGRTVMEFLRIRRLELGRDVLVRHGVSVAEAAHRAGYTSPANFATAFQREFGYPPSQVRGRA